MALVGVQGPRQEGRSWSSCLALTCCVALSGRVCRPLWTPVLMGQAGMSPINFSGQGEGPCASVTRTEKNVQLRMRAIGGGGDSSQGPARASVPELSSSSPLEPGSGQRLPPPPRFLVTRTSARCSICPLPAEHPSRSPYLQNWSDQGQGVGLGDRLRAAATPACRDSVPAAAVVRKCRATVRPQAGVGASVPLPQPGAPPALPGHLPQGWGGHSRQRAPPGPGRGAPGLRAGGVTWARSKGSPQGAGGQAT